MAITKRELIKKLCMDPTWEYIAAIQYIQHSGITDAAFGNIKKVIIPHGK